MTGKTKTKMTELIFGNFKYDDIMPFCGTNYTVAILNGKAGLIDLNGTSLTEFIYDDLREYCDDEDECNIWLIMGKYCTMRLNDKWGVLDDKGNVVYDFIYDNEIEMLDHEEYIYVYANGKTRVMDKDLKPILKNDYDLIDKACDDLFSVKINNKYGYVDKDDKIIIDFIYDEASPFNEYDLANVKVNDKWGIINKAGAFVQECIYDDINDWDEDEKIIHACKDKQIFHIDKTNGEIKYVGNFDKFDSFHHALWNHSVPFVIIEKQGKYGVADGLGNVVVKTFYDCMEINANRFIYGLDDKYGLIDFNGRLVTLAEYDWIKSSSQDGYFIANKGDKWGVIDIDGEKIIDFIYKNMDIFSIPGKYFFIAEKFGKKYGVISMEQEVVLDFIYDEVYEACSQDLKSLFFIAELDGKQALFNEDGVRIA